MTEPLLRSGKDAPGPIVPADNIDWRVIDKLSLWKLTVENEPDQFRYAINAVFADGTHVWTGILRDELQARQQVQRLAAEHDKPIERLGPGTWPHVERY